MPHDAELEQWKLKLTGKLIRMVCDWGPRNDMRGVVVDVFRYEAYGSGGGSVAPLAVQTAEGHKWHFNYNGWTVEIHPDQT